jgi:hypothetical protein
MPVSYEWDNPEKTTIHYHLDKHWTWEELRQAMIEAWPLIAEQAFVVDAYITSDGQHMPPNTMPHLRAMSQNRPANTGLMVLVGTNSFVKTMITTFMKVYSHMLSRETPLAFVDSVDEAREVIKRTQIKREGASMV